MIDKILYVNRNYAVIYFDTHSVGVSTDDRDVLELIDMLLAPLDSRWETRSDYLKALAISEEDTQIIEMNKVA